jgi:hypothetical protein
MKGNKTLVLAASILALTLAAFPHVAAAGTGTNQQPSPVPACSTGKHIQKVTVDLAFVLSLLSLL